jgi:hypothetical protein
MHGELRKRDPKAPLVHWTLHDLRRTGRTRLSEKALNVPYEVREAVIGHSKRGWIAFAINTTSSKKSAKRWPHGQLNDADCH